jgi:hypothetical protein
MGLIACPELPVTTNQCCVTSQGSENVNIVTCMAKIVYNIYCMHCKFTDSFKTMWEMLRT